MRLKATTEQQRQQAPAMDPSPLLKTAAAAMKKQKQPYKKDSYGSVKKVRRRENTTPLKSPKSQKQTQNAKHTSISNSANQNGQQCQQAPALDPSPLLKTVTARTSSRKRKLPDKKDYYGSVKKVRKKENTTPLKSPGSQKLLIGKKTCISKSANQNERFEKKYIKGGQLGSGGFGKVFAGIRRADGIPVAIKYINKLENDKELTIPRHGRLPLEVALMVLVEADPPCDNILQLLEWFEKPKYYILILERPVPCKDLESYRIDLGGCLSESMARGMMLQLLKALLHCKKCKIVHRDVKPENLLVQTDTLQIKLIDFGCGDLLQDFTYEDFDGTNHYAPPEWFLQDRYMAEPATVWSIGVTLYKLMHGHHPFKIKKWEIISDKLQISERLSSECRDLIRSCLSKLPEERPRLEQIGLHPWFQ